MKSLYWTPLFFSFFPPSRSFVKLRHSFMHKHTLSHTDTLLQTDVFIRFHTAFLRVCVNWRLLLSGLFSQLCHPACWRRPLQPEEFVFIWYQGPSSHFKTQKHCKGPVWLNGAGWMNDIRAVRTYCKCCYILYPACLMRTNWLDHGWDYETIN